MSTSRVNLDESVLDEIEALKSIYVNELHYEETANGEHKISMKLHPATADNVDEQFVCLTLTFSITDKYPDNKPVVSVSNPRGLSDDHLAKIRIEIETKMDDLIGCPMMFELIELVKDQLTGSNVPACACVICLYSFADADVLTKTDCYHYFHSHCLARYVKVALEDIRAKEREEKDKKLLHQSSTEQEEAVTCPVCRFPITYDLESLQNARSPVESISDSSAKDIVNSVAVRELQQSMRALYVRQKSNGGIIDVEVEKNRFFISISHQEQNGECQSSASSTEDQPTSHTTANGSVKDPSPVKPPNRFRTSSESSTSSSPSKSTTDGPIEAGARSKTDVATKKGEVASSRDGSVSPPVTNRMRKFYQDKSNRTHHRIKKFNTDHKEGEGVVGDRQFGEVSARNVTGGRRKNEQVPCLKDVNGSRHFVTR